jgi:uncharacterized protein with HEPN domain
VRSDRERLNDLLDAIARIQRHTDHGRDEFERDEMVQVWVIHHLQVIGEAARSISEELRQQHDQVEWAKVIGMRHILVHQYFGLKLDVIWDTVEHDLPTLQHAIASIVHDLSHGN